MGIRYSVCDLVNTMIELETEGEVFYTAAAEMTSNLAAKDLFSRLAKEEAHHRVFYEALRGKLRIEVEVDEEYARYMQTAVEGRFALDPERAGDCTTLGDALEIAVKLEKEALLFLGEFGSLVDSSHTADIDRMKQQERHHLLLIEQFRKDVGLG